MCKPFSLVGMRPTLIGVVIPLVTLILSFKDSFQLSYRPMQVKIVLSYHWLIVMWFYIRLMFLLIFFSPHFSLSYNLYSIRMKEKIKNPKVVVLTSTNCLDKNLFTIVANKKL